MLKQTKAVKPVTLRDIKIKTGVVKRTGQELVMYQKEYEKQKERIAKMVENNTDAHDIRKQNEVLDETVLMLPDCKKRLTRAYKELQEMLLTQESTEDVPPEITAAREIVEITAMLV